MHARMEASELTARESIRELVAAYAQLADGGRFEELLQLFTDDARLEIDGGAVANGRDALRNFFTGTGDQLRAATSRPVIRHHTSNLRITLSSPSEAEGTCYFFVVTERGPDHWGRYRDAYVVRDGRWLFRLRRVRLDGYAPGSWASERRGPS